MLSKSVSQRRFSLLVTKSSKLLDSFQAGFTKEMEVEGSNYCTFHSHWALWGLTCVIYSRAD